MGKNILYANACVLLMGGAYDREGRAGWTGLFSFFLSSVLLSGTVLWLICLWIGLCFLPYICSAVSLFWSLFHYFHLSFYHILIKHLCDVYFILFPSFNLYKFTFLYNVPLIPLPSMALYLFPQSLLYCLQMHSIVMLSDFVFVIHSIL